MEKLKYNENKQMIISNLIEVIGELNCFGYGDESMTVNKMLKKIADDRYINTGDPRDTNEGYPLAINFEGRLNPDEKPQTGKRRFQTINRQDRNAPQGDRYPEGYGAPGWESPVDEDIVGQFDPDLYNQTYNAPIGNELGVQQDAYLNIGGYQTSFASTRGVKMEKTANPVAHPVVSVEELVGDTEQLRKELGITLNASGMPSVDFRDGSFIEIRTKLGDCRGRNQGVDAETEFVVVATYPSLQYEKLVGSSGYRTVTAAEKMLTNYARVHLARGLTYTP